MNKKGFTLIEMISAVALLALVVVLATFSLSRYLMQGKEKAFNILANSFEDGVLEAFTSCLVNPESSDFCKTHQVPEIGERQWIYLSELTKEKEEFVEKFKNPWNTKEECNPESYVIAIRENTASLSFKYITCLKCGDHETPGCTPQ